LIRWILSAAVLLVPAQLAMAQTPDLTAAPVPVPAPQTSAPAGVGPRVGVNAAAPHALTLADAIRLALEQNNDVSIARLDTAIAQQDIRVAEGVFDPRLVPSLSYQRSTAASASAIGGAVNGAVEQIRRARAVGGRSIHRRLHGRPH
jgi:outer membrane protein TolC